MSANEITTVTRQYRERAIAILTSDQVAQYDTYEQRVQVKINAHASGLIEPTVVEQAVLNKIAADAQAAVLHKQFMVLLRIETLLQ
jgi:hypothetical protein